MQLSKKNRFILICLNTNILQLSRHYRLDYVTPFGANGKQNLNQFTLSMP